MERRIKIGGLICIIIFALLILRLGQLQIIHGEQYSRLADGNRIENRPIPAPRGRVFMQREGEPVIAVSNRLAYSASVIPANIPPGEMDNICDELGRILGMEPYRIIERIQSSQRALPVRIKRNLTPQQLLILEENLRELPGVIIEKIPIRDNVYGSTAAHLLGYVGEVSLSEISFFEGYRSGDLIGKSGLERSYEPFLRGVDGIRQIEVNAHRMEIATLGIRDPQPGADLYISIDLDLQMIAEQVLKEKILELQEMAKEDEDLMGGPTGGSFIAMEPNTGKILAMASYPTFDLNLFAGGIERSELEKLQNNFHRPFLDRNIQITPAPGSTFKVITGMAVLKDLNLSLNRKTAQCTGTFTLGPQEWKCWRDGGHGQLTFFEALAHSCNVAFYRWGHELHHQGNDTIQKIAREFGFGFLTGIDLPNEKAGIVPDRDWKMNHLKGPWVPGDSVNMAIGQGDLQATPLQLVNMINTVANGGYLMQPFIVERIIDNNGEKIFEGKPEVIRTPDVSREIIETIQTALQEVTEYGTGLRGFGDFVPRVAGKTGTAQTVPGQANHGWYAGYVPADNPEISFVVFLEHGSDSGFAVDVGRAFLEYYYPQEEEVAEE